MDYARWVRRLEWAVAAAVVGLHLVIFLWPENVSRPNLLLTSVHDAQHLSGIVLVVAWSILGPGRLWIRLAALPALIVLWFLKWNTRMVPRDVRDEFLHYMLLTAAIVAVAIRLCGLRIARLPTARAAERGSQFSLLALLVSTTLIASLVGVLEWLRPALVADQGASLFANVIDNWQFRRIATTPEPPLNPLLARHLVMASAVVATALGGLWIVLRPGAIWLRLAAMAAAITTLGVYLTHLEGTGGDEFVPSAINLGIGLGQIAGMVGITALPLRLMGYRLQRQPRSVAVTTSPVTERQRVIGRAAALTGFLLLIAGSILCTRIAESRYGARASPPMKAFADWMEPWRRRRQILITTIGSAIHIYKPIPTGIFTTNYELNFNDGSIITSGSTTSTNSPSEAEPQGSAASGGSLGPSNEEDTCPNL